MASDEKVPPLAINDVKPRPSRRDNNDDSDESINGMREDDNGDDDHDMDENEIQIKMLRRHARDIAATGSFHLIYTYILYIYLNYHSLDLLEGDYQQAEELYERALRLVI
jgi:hypothetical protein